MALSLLPGGILGGRNIRSICSKPTPAEWRPGLQDLPKSRTVSPSRWTDDIWQQGWRLGVSVFMTGTGNGARLSVIRIMATVSLALRSPQMAGWPQQAMILISGSMIGNLSWLCLRER